MAETMTITSLIPNNAKPATMDKIPAKIGRPRAITRGKIAKLEHALKMGHTIDYACKFTGVHQATYHREYKDNDIFACKMDIARHYAKDKSLKNVVFYIDRGDLETSKWLLEHRYSKEFSKSPEVAVQVNNFTVDFIDDDGEMIEVS